MADKKEFNIPRNYSKKFEFVPGISGWYNLIFIPLVGLGYLMWQYLPIDPSHKIGVSVVLIGVPYVLFGTHQIRENVPLYKHLLWKLQFLSRQRSFKYEKEGYKHAIQKESTANRKENLARKEAAITSQKNDSRFNTTKRPGARITYNSRSKDGSYSKSVGR